MIKRITLFLLLLVLSLSAQATITPEKTYNYICSSTMLNETDYKLFAMDATLNKCRIYNTDHSVYKTISLSIPTGMYLYDIRFVTENLFDLDAGIELLYVYYEYVVTDATAGTGYYDYYTRVINEDGTEILSVDGGLYSYMYRIDATDFRMFIYSYDYSSWPYDMKTSIFELPGYPFLLKSDEVSSKSASIGDAYPNPANNFVTVEYSLPEGVSAASLKIYTMSGSLMKSYNVDKTFKSLRLDAATLLPGSYLYYIESEGQKSESKQLIIK
ncbi:MAG: T9SS type A sorting domain-containing protein [Bacteroidales bacterium]|jgi:hypothetical protein|nr:T9SS type A sorting domain-containing protein [Bacteroidales bacterium]